MPDTGNHLSLEAGTGGVSGSSKGTREPLDLSGPFLSLEVSRVTREVAELRSDPEGQASRSGL